MTGSPRSCGRRSSSTLAKNAAMSRCAIGAIGRLHDDGSTGAHAYAGHARGTIGAMTRGHRLSALDASFLHLEKAGARLHVASVTVFDGPTPPYDELLAHIESRLHLVPRFRQRLAEIPLDQGRPVWVDDPHFNLRYHLRHAGLPAPGSEEQLKNLASRVFAQRLDRTKPLWELLLVDGLDGGGFALVAKSHHALVDGISAVDITTALFDADPDAPPPQGPAQAV